MAKVANVVEGIKHVNFQDQKTGQHIEGVSIYFSFPITKNGEGKAFDKAFISADRLGQMGGNLPMIGSQIELTYNKFGRVIGFEVI